VPSWLTCVVLSGYFPCKVTINLISATPSDMGEAWSLRPNVEMGMTLLVG
jgi:hypothetical protein